MLPGLLARADRKEQAELAAAATLGPDLPRAAETVGPGGKAGELGERRLR